MRNIWPRIVRHVITLDAVCYIVNGVKEEVGESSRVSYIWCNANTKMT